MTATHMIVDGPWPERHGCLCAIAEPTPEQAARYPFTGLGNNEVVVLIDNDPLPPPGMTTNVWSCVIDADHLKPIE